MEFENSSTNESSEKETPGLESVSIYKNPENYAKSETHANSGNYAEPETHADLENLTGHENFAGPLNLNKETRRATTVMGLELVLGENDFEALDLFVTNVGKYLTFQQLYDAAWGRSESTKSLTFASAALDNLVLHINNVGDEFMWIEQTPGLGYVFYTCWGNDWNKQSGIKVYTPSKAKPSAIVAKNTRKPRSPVPMAFIVGASTIAAAIVIVFLLLIRTGVITPTEAEPIHIEMEDPAVPLAPPDNLENE